MAQLIIGALKYQVWYNSPMASISKRTNRTGTTTWRVLFRRKGLPTFCATFRELKEAIQFAQREDEYLFDYDTFIKSMPNALDAKRRREFNYE